MLRDGFEIQEVNSPPVVINAGADSPGDGSRDVRDLIAISQLDCSPTDESAAEGAAYTSMMTYSPTNRSGSDAGSSASFSNRSPIIRRTGSQIDTLKAKFEMNQGKSLGETTPVKRFERFPVRAHSPRGPEADLETAKLKELLKEASARCVVLEEKVRRLEEAGAERQKYLYQDRLLKLEKELERQKEENGKLQRRIQLETNATNEAESREDASRAAMRQLQELKRSISTSTWAGNQVTDSTFAQETIEVHHQVQNWVVTNFRRCKITSTPEELCERLESISEPKQMDYLKSIFQSYDPSVKLQAMQAVVVCYLVETFEDPMLFGFQGDCRRYLRKATETLPSVLDPGTFNRWRSFTLDLVRKSERIQDSVESASRSMSEMICIVLNTLTGVENFESQISTLTPIVKRAISLSHLFRVQRAEYEFRLPFPGERFTQDSMEDFSVDADDTTERTVKCTTFPSVVKRGDENGDNSQLTNTIVKAKVLCES